LDLAQAMEARFGDRPLIAADFAREMLVRGRTKVSAAVPLAVGDAMRLPVRDGVMAGMTCAFGMRNLSDVRRGLQEAYRVLKPGGAFVVLEFYRPSTFVMRAFHAIYARFVLPTVGYLVSRDREAYGYLARSMKGFYTRSEFEALAREVGFSAVQGEDLTLGIASLVRMVK
jgi:ubiquinone/menaquinone biosynthesis methyltransferase